MFINFTNHSAAFWGEKQKTQALRYGEIVDILFPSVSALADEQKIKTMAVSCVGKIKKQNPKAVLCQGEFSLSFAVVALLLKENITVLCACSERQTIEKNHLDGTTSKETIFTFQQFRKYQI